MMKRIIFFLVLFLGFLFPVKALAAARLSLEPASGNYSSGNEFSVKIKVDTGGQQAMVVDALLTFDSSRLEVKQVVSGGFFSGFDYDLSNSGGKLAVYNFAEQALQSKSGVGDVAVITFKALSSGVASVSFLCQPGNTTDSAIWDPVGNDLIDCAANGGGSYTIDAVTGGTSPTNTPAPTPTTVSSIPTSAPEAPTPTSSQLPTAGVETPILILLTGGALITLLGIALGI